MDEGIEKPKIGSMFRGQAWVALHGDFTIEQLKILVERLEKNCEGLENKNVNKE